MVNKYIGIGRLTKDVELRYTSSNKAVANFTVACDSGYGDNKQTEFIDCVIWEKKAENMSKFTRKGSLVYVEGKIKKRNYEAQDGSKRYITEVVVYDVKFLDSKKDLTTAPGATNGGETYNPFPQEENDDPFDSASTVDIGDSELPF